MLLAHRCDRLRPKGHSREPTSDRELRVANVSFGIMAAFKMPADRTSDSRDDSSLNTHAGCKIRSSTNAVARRYFKRSELRSDFAPVVSSSCDLFGATVQISPTELIKRHCTDRQGIVTESIYASARSNTWASGYLLSHCLSSPG